MSNHIINTDHKSLLFLEHGQTLGTIPLALGLCLQRHAGKVKPLDRAILEILEFNEYPNDIGWCWMYLVVAPYHFSVADLLAEAVRLLVGVNWHVNNGHRGVRHIQIQIFAICGGGQGGLGPWNIPCGQG